MRNETHEEFISNLSKIFQTGSEDINLGISKLVKFKEEQIQKAIKNLDPLDQTKEDAEEIYNWVINFFSQYYKGGKLTSKIRHNLYPSNYNGLILDWLNKDQYYIKSKDVQYNNGEIISEDFFVHRDILSFLKTEVDSFIKNTILDLESLQNTDIQVILKKLKIFEDICLKIINTLTRLELCQLQLWHRKNFVIETNYVITLNKIKENVEENVLKDIYEKILSSKAQLKEWYNLFGIKIFNKTQFDKDDSRLKYLPIDTIFFDEEFKWKLINSISNRKNLDNLIDGILIKSDNFQALNVLMKKWHEKIDLIYIDPPFNTGKKEFHFKNDYSIPTWLVMMNNRLNLAKEILNKKGSIFVRIDNKGNHLVRYLLDSVFNKSNFRNEIIINKTKAKKQRKKPFIQQTESLFFYSKSDNYFFNPLQLPRKHPKWYELLDFPRPNENPRTVLGKIFYPPKNRRWGLSQERINEFERKGKVRINKSKKYVDCFENIIEEKPELYYDLEAVRNDWLDIPGYSQVHKFSTENSEELLQRVIECGSKRNDIILDFFLGSGTTVAVAHKLNRKWIGIELGNQFENFILPRMKTVLKGDKTGISKTMEISNGGFFKYHYFENFEDTLENLEFYPHFCKLSPNLDNVEDPFNFSINVLKNDRILTKKVDLVETFNYLLGIHVEKVIKKDHNGRIYVIVKGKIDSDNVIVIWRSVIGLEFNEDKKIIKSYINEDNYHYLYINGKYQPEGFRSIELALKHLMGNCEIV